jgi:PAS domain-containing protein
MKENVTQSKIEGFDQTTARLKERADKANQSFRAQVIESQRLATQAIAILRDRVAQITKLNQALANATAARIRAEEALGESEARYRITADVVPVLVWQSGTDKLRTYFNKRWIDFTGRSREQELSNGWVEGGHPDDLQHCIETYTLAFE